jgi:hypothetical protein
MPITLDKRPAGGGEGGGLIFWSFHILPGFRFCENLYSKGIGQLKTFPRKSYLEKNFGFMYSKLAMCG